MLSLKTSEEGRQSTRRGKEEYSAQSDLEIKGVPANWRERTAVSFRICQIVFFSEREHLFYPANSVLSHLVSLCSGEAG